MNPTIIRTIQTVAVWSLALARLPAEEIPVPNASFEELYRPGSTVLTADIGGGWTNGVGPNTPMQAGQTVNYSNGRTGTSVDVPGWINAPDWPNAYDWTQGSGTIAKQNPALDGLHYFSANGDTWGNPTGGAIESAAPLTTVTTQGGALSYTVTIHVFGGVDPVYLALLADGVPLTPSSTVDPGPPYAWDQVSKTYDAVSLDGQLGKSLRIRLGWGSLDPEVVTTGLQSRIDVVSLDYTPGNPPGFPLVITPNQPDSRFKLEWDSRENMLYRVLENTGLGTPIDSWSELAAGIAATPPTNTYNVDPADPTLFYAVEEYPAPPMEIFSESFDGAAGPGLPTGWTSGTNPADNSSLTSWEVGTPSNVGPIPPGVPLPSGANCVATNISGNYDDPVTDLGIAHTDIWLRSPAIDLGAATTGTLSFQQWTQIEDVPGDLDYGSIRILDADDDSVLATLEDQSIDGSTSGWAGYSNALPAAAFTATAGTIKIEFQFEADDIDSFAGWYIDEVTVTVP